MHGDSQSVAEMEDATHGLSSSTGRRPHILFVSRKWPPAMGGMETYSHRLSALLEDVGAVELKVLRGNLDGSAPGFVSLFQFGLSAGFSILLRRRAADIVHVADMAIWPLAVIARLRSRRTRAVLSAHGTDVAYPDHKGILPRAYGIYIRIGARLHGRNPVIANSRATRAKAEQLGFAHIAVVPLASDMPAQGSAPDSSVSGSARRLLFAGRLVERKGCRWFVENVLPRLPDDVMLDVAGTVWDDREADALNSPRVRHLGLLESDQLARAYASAACVVVPNIAISKKNFEGFGLVAVEAAMAGGIVLASEHTGLMDAVIDGETGFMLPPGDAAAWVAAINRVLEWTVDTRAAFVKNSTLTAREHFSWDRVARDTFEAYGWAAET